jgi:hypothetical protein
MAFSDVVTSDIPRSWDELADVDFTGNYPSEEGKRRLLDEHLFQRAVQVYLSALPVMNMVAIRDSSEATWGRGYNVLPVWKRRMDARCRVPTPNADVIYAMGYLDLKEDGPLVVQSPPGIFGMLTDFWQRAFTDVGLAGPDRGEGGMYLLVPPHYDGPPLPGGYEILHSPTYNVFLFWRAFLERGAVGPDPRKGVQQIEQTVIYPLRQTVPSHWKPMQFPDASGVEVDMLFPRDASYFDRLAAFAEYEPISAIDLSLRGMMASLGLVKGQPFDPSPRLRQILAKAAAIAPKMASAINFTADAYPDRLYYGGDVKRNWVNVFPDVDENFLTDSYLHLDHRAAFFSFGYSASPAMVGTRVGAGAKYPYALKDADGRYFSGEHSYRLHLPPDPPARLFWAVTIYNPVDGTMIDQGQPFPSVNALDGRVKPNADGSYDIHFGPEQPAGVAEQLDQNQPE